MTAYRAPVADGQTQTCAQPHPQTHGSEPHWALMTEAENLPPTQYLQQTGQTGQTKQAPDTRQAAGTGLVTRIRQVAEIKDLTAAAGMNWPLEPALGRAEWVHFPSAGTCVRDIGAESVHACRDFVTATLRRWGAAERQDDVAVVVSELVTNALRHALPAPAPAAGSVRWPIQVGLAWPMSGLLCAVSDPSDLLPVPRVADPLDETGRGLHVVAALSDEWGCSEPGPTGKTVWARFVTAAVPPPAL
jgi:Histidine kinase-like ATPase domain